MPADVIEPGPGVMGRSEDTAAAASRLDDPLFVGVDVLCDQIVRDIGVGGAAAAVLTGSSHVRELVYATDAVAHGLDELQFTLGQGPCLDAFIHERPRLWAAMALAGADTVQWSAFAVEAIALGARAVFAFPIPGWTRQLGVLELYRSTPGALSGAEERLAAACATAIGHTLIENWEMHRANVISAEVVIDAVVDAMASIRDTGPFTRAAIHIASGITAVQLDASPAEALDLLRAHSYAQHRSVSSVAADVIARRLTLATTATAE